MKLEKDGEVEKRYRESRGGSGDEGDAASQG